jgi:NAD(P)-dependent dehydrogenase (short-subunit alcohol dehydrogenase family)
MNLFSLRNKTILITGASSGIGRATAISCDEQGANLILIGRDVERLTNTLNLLSNNSHKILLVDLTDFSALSTKLNSIFNEIDVIDGIVNAAGITSTLPFRIFKPKKLEEIFKINVTSAFQLTKLLLPKLNNKGTSIVFISSVMSNFGDKGKTMYSITKGGISAGARSLALEYASKKIRVNTIAPGIVNTPMIQNASYKIDEKLYNKTIEKYPLGFGEAEDVANCCVFLLSDASRWITGSEIVIDGGFSAK